MASTLLLFYKTFAMIIFLPLKRFTVYFSMELFIGDLKTFPLEIVGGLEWYEYVRNGGLVACVNGGRGFKFFSFWCVRTN